MKLKNQKVRNIGQYCCKNYYALVETGIKSYLNIRIMVDTAQYDKRQIIENNNKNDHRLMHYKFVSYFEWMFDP